MSDLFQLNPETEMIWYGVIYFLTSGVMIPFYILIMTALFRKDSNSPNMTYKLINIINSIELMKVVCHFITAPVFMFPAMQTSFEVGSRIIGSALNVCWIGTVPLMATLSITRVFIFRGQLKSEKMPLAVKVVVTVVLTFMFVMFVISSISQNFLIKPPSWGYDRSDPFTDYHRAIDQVVQYTSLAISYAANLLIVAMIFMKKKNASVTCRKREIAILVQYTLATTYIFTLIVCYYQKGLFDLTSNRTIAGFNTFWILSSCISPLSLLIMNKTIREECKLIIWKDPNQQHILKVGPHSTSHG